MTISIEHNEESAPWIRVGWRMRIECENSHHQSGPPPDKPSQEQHDPQEVPASARRKDCMKVDKQLSLNSFIKLPLRRPMPAELGKMVTSLYNLLINWIYDKHKILLAAIQL
ncbi:hypothetical protein SELMODRAFT_442029 [Selaginella moellendorffii]|uniref:Uncharacterized protein n=1 Tax=Selaginella moellendorffii TaxID=88036 RepID=D8RQS0_SELML|nr:hypothetical protein SELMODRAFT_442029 [Selaginella moellendorffii]